MEVQRKIDFHGSQINFHGRQLVSLQQQHHHHQHRHHHHPLRNNVDLGGIASSATPLIPLPPNPIPTSLMTPTAIPSPPIPPPPMIPSSAIPPHMLPTATPSSPIPPTRPRLLSNHSTSGPYLRFQLEDEVVILNLGSDIDHTNYQLLLALRRQIGGDNVETALSEETILRRLNTTVFHSSSASAAMNQENCIVCQSQLEDKDKIATLDCCHVYHAECITKWLQVKNVCPLCKKPGLDNIMN